MRRHEKALGVEEAPAELLGEVLEDAVLLEDLGGGLQACVGLVDGAFALVFFGEFGGVAGKDGVVEGVEVALVSGVKVGFFLVALLLFFGFGDELADVV